MKRASGVLMHVSSLWGEYSSGSFGSEAREWIDYLASCGFSYWQVLPFCLPDAHNSPYASFSAFSGNPAFIDLPTLCAEGLLTKDELAGAKQNTPYACEFDRLKSERMALLEKAAGRFTDEKAMAEFFAAHQMTEQFCTYMALKEANGQKAWTEWTVGEPDARALKLWRFTQYAFFTQWAALKAYAEEKGVAVIGDLPIYVATDSSDVWAAPTLFRLGRDGKPSCVAGVPPDYFCADGQRWGNPLYAWDEMEKDGFAWWRERMRFTCELFDGVRIDHFRGLESYYAIPAEEETARNGHWVKGPGMKLLSALQPITKDKLIIAEDLGDITDEVRALVKESGFPGMRVIQFGFLGDKDSPHLPHNYENNCVAYSGTHDNNTLLGFVWEQSEEDRRRLLAYCGFDGADWNACYDHVLRALFASGAGLVMLPVQDLLLYGSDTRLNKPGEADGNWSYRITREQLNGVNKEKFRLWNDLYAR